MVEASRMRRSLRAGVLGLSLVLAGACGETDGTGPSGNEPLAEPPALAVTSPAGIVFASFGLSPSQLGTVHTGIVGPSTPSALRDYLSQVRSRGGRVLIKLSGGDKAVKNDDGTFNLTKWKAAVDRFRKVDFATYVNDGTIVGHFLIDEPHFPSRWGGKTIPHATLEEAAKYSRSIWPGMPTIVSAPANWLANTTVTYTHLDAAWANYRATASASPATWISNQVKKAKSKGLGLVAGLNVLDGGDGSSGFSGNYPKKWAMSASELRTYGSALLAQSHVCAFAMWEYRSAYYDRPDIKSAMGELAAKARSHAKTSCRQ